MGLSPRPSIVLSLAVQHPLLPLGTRCQCFLSKYCTKQESSGQNKAFLMLFPKHRYSSMMGVEEGGREEDLEILQIAQPSLFTTSDKAMSVFLL